MKKEIIAEINKIFDKIKVYEEKKAQFEYIVKNHNDVHIQFRIYGECKPVSPFTGDMQEEKIEFAKKYLELLDEKIEEFYKEVAYIVEHDFLSNLKL